MATTTEKPIATTVTSAADSSAEPNPNKTVDHTSPSTDKSDPPTDLNHPDENEGSKTTDTAVGSAAGENSGPANDVEKKMRRAERFGVPVKLSEQEKRNSRAERFGGAPSSNGSEASKQSEELKRKARAERFGIAAPAPTPAPAPAPTATTDEDAKKKARLARFAPYSKPDSVEEEKRKQRAARFSNPSPTSVNGKGNNEPEVPIAGEAGLAGGEI